MEKENKLLNNQCTILVSTCAKFSDLWKNYVVLIKRFWPNHPRVLFVSDAIPEGFNDFPFEIKICKGEFSFRIKEALSVVKTKYVLFTLDDYLINNYVNEYKLNYLLAVMDSNKFDYCRIYKRAKVKPWFDKKNKIKILPLTRKCYEVNLYTSLWKKDSLSKIITDDLSPWVFEVLLTKKAREANYKCIASFDEKIYPFIDTVRKGKYLRRAYRFLKANNLYISDRKIRTKKEDAVLFIKTFISRHFASPLKKALIKIFKIKRYSEILDE